MIFLFQALFALVFLICRFSWYLGRFAFYYSGHLYDNNLKPQPFIAYHEKIYFLYYFLSPSLIYIWFYSVVLFLLFSFASPMILSMISLNFYLYWMRYWTYSTSHLFSLTFSFNHFFIVAYHFYIFSSPYILNRS